MTASPMYESILTQSGLRDEQALLYETLLKNGSLSAGELYKKTSFKRGLIYKVLDELEELALIERMRESGKIMRFSAVHPSALKDLADRRERAAKDAKMSLESAFPALLSDFNLGSSRPGVEIYEGLEGIERVLNDSLTAKEIISSYVDVEAVERSIRDINERYLKKRERLDIYKRLLVPDTPFVRNLYAQEKSLSTEVRAISKSPVLFEVSMQIYDGKVSYLVLEKEKFMGIILSSPSIYLMHKYLFETVYEKAEVITR